MSVIEELRKLHEEEDLENFFHGYVDLARTERLRQLFAALPALLDCAEALGKVNQLIPWDTSDFSDTFIADRALLASQVARAALEKLKAI